VCIGLLGVGADVYNDLTLREIFYKIEGYNEAKENEMRMAFESSRFTAWLVVSAMSSNSVPISDFYRFPWESPREVFVMSTDRFEELKRTWLNPENTIDKILTLKK
jgi:hypothetical protein